jgi:DMSO/TMAO reductase YedYZ molybdopterin-dependent catalytic subunit
MARRIERGLHELYREDPQRADALVFERRTHSDRRGFPKGVGLTTMGTLLGGFIPFHRQLPAGLIPAALAQDLGSFKIEGKDGLTVLNHRPLNAETPPPLLNDAITPTARHFVRNIGIPPQSMDPAGWTLTVDGLVDKLATTITPGTNVGRP